MYHIRQAILRQLLGAGFRNAADDLVSRLSLPATTSRCQYAQLKNFFSSYPALNDTQQDEHNSDIFSLTKSQLSKKTKAWLAEACDLHGLDSAGLKDDLLSRLEQLRAQQLPQQQPTAPDTTTRRARRTTQQVTVEAADSTPAQHPPQQQPTASDTAARRACRTTQQATAEAADSTQQRARRSTRQASGAWTGTPTTIAGDATAQRTRRTTRQSTNTGMDANAMSSSASSQQSARTRRTTKQQHNAEHELNDGSAGSSASSTRPFMAAHAAVTSPTVPSMPSTTATPVLSTPSTATAAEPSIRSTKAVPSTPSTHPATMPSAQSMEPLPAPSTSQAMVHSMQSMQPVLVQAPQAMVQSVELVLVQDAPGAPQAMVQSMQSMEPVLAQDAPSASQVNDVVPSALQSTSTTTRAASSNHPAATSKPPPTDAPTGAAADPARTALAELIEISCSGQPSQEHLQQLAATLRRCDNWTVGEAGDLAEACHHLGLQDPSLCGAAWSCATGAGWAAVPPSALPYLSWAGRHCDPAASSSDMQALGEVAASCLADLVAAEVALLSVCLAEAGCHDSYLTYVLTKAIQARMDHMAPAGLLAVGRALQAWQVDDLDIGRAWMAAVDTRSADFQQDEKQQLAELLSALSFAIIS